MQGPPKAAPSGAQGLQGPPKAAPGPGPKPEPLVGYQGVMSIYGAKWCPHCKNEVNSFAGAGIPFKFINADPGSGGKAFDGVDGFPTNVCPNGLVVGGERSPADILKACDVSLKCGLVPNKPVANVGGPSLGGK